MVIRDETSSVEITLRETGATQTPAVGDLRINVAVTAVATVVGGPFTGRNDTVWIRRDEWAGFLQKLRELERIRRGKAHLSAMSPAEFQVTIFITDGAGHVAAEDGSAANTPAASPPRTIGPVSTSKLSQALSHSLSVNSKPSRPLANER